MNNNNNQELADAINDFNQSNNRDGINSYLVDAVIESCQVNNIAFNNIANNAHVITEYLEGDDMVLSGDESLDSDIQPRINVQNIQQNVVQHAVNVQPNVQQNVVQPIASRTRTQIGTIKRQNYRGM